MDIAPILCRDTRARYIDGHSQELQQLVLHQIAAINVASVGDTDPPDQSFC
jgi:hypothetical protein